ncbi:phage integrase family protein [Streptomyces sp. BK022]|uniref:tyrosine-type recombinase/integrase n=1 Tax=Streptomyces sp. BK022 TaxID=2512123 RepID=UPI0010297F2F|nr:tyrosine-type recombinase/integrase [Streptomyces sp. BK022]RZU28275.1 phage integrase family protein [Streptomyces sp. BK022]
MTPDDEEIVTAEIVDDGGALAVIEEPAPRPLVDAHTVLFPGEEIPTTDTPGVTYSERDLHVSEETAEAIKKAREEESPPRRTAMRLFEAWCAQEGRVAKPCTTATYTEYGRHLMRKQLKVTTINNYMSLIMTSMPPGKRPDKSIFKSLMVQYRKKNKRALRRKEAFPITLAYLMPMLAKADAADRPIAWRDSAMMAFGYQFLGRSVEDVDFDIEDLTILDDRVIVWLAEDKTHDDEQTIVLHDRTDLRLVFRLRRWLGYLQQQGITSGPLFREVKRSGKVASSETRAKTATKRGDYLRPQTVNERVKLWFKAAGLVTDGRPVSSHSLRAGGATDLGMNNATEEELEDAGRWRRGSRMPRIYVRAAKDANRNRFAKVPIYDPDAQEPSA